MTQEEYKKEVENDKYLIPRKKAKNMNFASF